MNKFLWAISILMLMSGHVFAQSSGWQNKDLDSDSAFGISTEKAYSLLKGKKAKPVLVAVIDSGIDTAHEDLKPVIWINPNESVNGKDEDHNGYIDDLHGWDFIGGKTGNVEFDNLEMTRLVRRDGSFYDSLSHIKVPDVYQSDYQAYRNMKKNFDQRLRQAQNSFARISRFKSLLDTMVRKIGIDNPTCKDFENFHAENEELQQARELAIQEMRRHNEFRALQEQVKNMYDQFKEMKDYSLNLDYDPRKLIGDDYSNSGEKYYGNNDVFGPNAQHGTHVAGIIAAARDNGLGMQGIADRAQIMCLRAVPRGDERDKDVANAIRYAVDNGAKIINMSFGKRYSWDKKIVDDAVKYAMNKDVLIIHAVGNDGLNLDNIDNQVFPNKYYADSSGVAEGWINVGASGWKDDSTLVAPFSNYGKTTVDVFAPGVQIYSTTPGSHYEKLDGTSMAAPVVTGLAALIREYYPKLTAVQVKDIIMKSVVKRPVLADKCVSAGVVNAYNAIGGIVIE